MNSAGFTFRRVERADLGMIYRWRQAEHVREWWDPPASWEAFRQKMLARVTGNHAVEPYLMLYDGRPTGYIQTYSLGASPDVRAALGLLATDAGIDLFIGEREYLHRGLGPLFLRAFLRDILFARPDVTGCGIWPEPGNAIAIAAYEHAGFHYLRTVTIPPQNERAYVMYMARDELWRDVFAGSAASALHGAASPME